MEKTYTKVMGIIPKPSARWFKTDGLYDFRGKLFLAIETVNGDIHCFEN